MTFASDSLRGTHGTGDGELSVHASEPQADQPAAGTQEMPDARSGLMRLPLWLLQFAFGWCNHGHTSRVFTIRQRTYQVCLECGEEFEYSWARMEVLPPKAAAQAYAPPDRAPGLLARFARALNLFL